MRKYEIFRESNYMLLYLYNILYRIVKRFFLICGCKYGWSYHIKTSYIFVCIIIYLFVLELLSSTSKLPQSQQKEKKQQILRYLDNQGNFSLYIYIFIKYTKAQDFPNQMKIQSYNDKDLPFFLQFMAALHTHLFVFNKLLHHSKFTI